MWVKIFVISDNADTCTGLRLVGIDGVIVQSESDFSQTIANILANEDIAILAIVENLARKYAEKVDEIRFNRRLPLIVEIPDKHGSGQHGNHIWDMIGSAL